MNIMENKWKIMEFIEIISPQPGKSQPYPVPIPLPQAKSRPLSDSRGIPDSITSCGYSF